jgi:hypothetical protein
MDLVDIIIRMGAKKKVEVQQAPPQPQPEKPSNTILKVTTSDQK